LGEGVGKSADGGFGRGVGGVADDGVEGYDGGGEDDVAWKIRGRRSLFFCGGWL